jgi:valyl-tRNA synthetase
LSGTKELSPLEKTYSPRKAEAKWYALWERAGYFHATVNPQRTPYTIVIPPPNVTGVLHMGHILNNVVQDALIRYKRMTGFEACWVPGMDHAGIATQHVVERSLAKEGKTRQEIGRDDFVKHVWEWKTKYGGIIIRQLRSLGASCDWEREKFTMDETLSTAVREVFVRLYEEGLIYRGKYIVNWCPKDHTALSDDEVVHTDQSGKLYTIRYPLAGETRAFIPVATTRPETLLGDTAVAVHPDDKRYQALIGRMAVLPLTDREIPIVADEFVDQSFGTGAVKVTPAHDPNDYWIGQRHNLLQINIFDGSACLNENVPAAYRGLDRYAAREAVLKDLRNSGLFDKAVDHVNAIGRCYRCNTVIEPYLSDQWFVRMEPLAAPALEVVRNGSIRFFPDRWAKVYENWMTNIRDWCISRQLWWGHRIPVWYCEAETGRTENCSRPIVSQTQPSRCPHCGGRTLRQDEDVLDTWFSSWLWPFSVHDWPRQDDTGKAPDLRYFYPTDTLVTAPEIIFFWVARMIMAGLKFGPTFTGSSLPAQNIPFRDVYFTSIVRDDQGRKMSKSLGNSPEPMDLINEYGADAVRFSILYLAPLGQDIMYAKEKNEIGRNFANKVWNAGRFLLQNQHALETEEAGEQPSDGNGDLADRWIMSRLHSTLRETETAFASYEMNKVSRTVYEFLWHDFCDWYIEMIKSRLYSDESASSRRELLQRALHIFDIALRLLHPLMPFVTEELWQRILRRAPGETIMRAEIPKANESLIDTSVERQMAFIQDVVEAVRTIRGEMSIPPSREITLMIAAGHAHSEAELRQYETVIRRLAKIGKISFVDPGSRPKIAATAVVEGEELFIPLEGLIDLDLERARLQKEIERLDGMLGGIRTKLNNPRFVEKAPKDIVAREREKEASVEAHLNKLTRNLALIEKTQ